jgi:hypothetical protein
MLFSESASHWATRVYAVETSPSRNNCDVLENDLLHMCNSKSEQSRSSSCITSFSASTHLFMILCAAGLRRHASFALSPN